MAFGAASVTFVQSSNPFRVSLPLKRGEYEGQMGWDKQLRFLGLLQYLTHCILLIGY